jgi:hypothetical protein
LTFAAIHMGRRTGFCRKPVLRLRRIELPEIARVVGDEDEVAVARIAHDIPVLPAGAADMRDVLGFMAAFPGNGD